MRVTSLNDHVESTIISKNETHEMGITDNAEFFQLLSATLYSDQQLAVIREVLCNAWDAHIDAGITDKPIKVTLNNDYLTIQDFGYGIPKKDFPRIYGVYGESTKQTQSNQTGGFGLGCKSPFAYTDHFQVTSIHGNDKTLYNLSKTSSEVYGKPGITEILSSPFEEYSGITVKLKIKTEEDRRIFEKNIYTVVRNGEMNVELNDEPIGELLGLSSSEFGFIITQNDVLNSFEQIFIRYGSVIYPVPQNKEYEYELNAILSLLDGIGRNKSIVFQAPENSINVVPSREQLSNNGQTVTTIKKIFKNFIPNIRTFDHDLVWEYQKNLIDKFASNNDFEYLFKNKGILENYNSSHSITTFDEISVILSTIHYPVQIWEDDFKYRTKKLYDSLTNEEDKRSLSSLSYAILNQVKKEGGITSKNGKQYLSFLGSPILKWFYRFKLKRISDLVDKYPDLKKSSFKLINTQTYRTEFQSINDWYVAMRYEKGLDIVKSFDQTIVLAHGPNTVKEERHFLTENTAFKDNFGVIVYIVPRSNKAVNATREIFEKENINVVDFLTLREFSGRKKSTKTNIAPKRTGMISLSDLHITAGSAFPKTSLNEDTFTKIKNPDCFLWGDDFVEGGSDGYFGETLELMIKHYGQHGAYTRTPTQRDKCQIANIPPLKEKAFIGVCNLFLKDKEFRNYVLSQNSSILAALQYNSTYNVLDFNRKNLIELMVKSDDLSKLIKVPTPLETSNQFYLDNYVLFKKMIQQRVISTIDTLSNPEENQLYQEVAKILRTKPIRKPFETVLNKLAKSPLVACLDLFKVRHKLDNKNMIRLLKFVLKG